MNKKWYIDENGIKVKPCADCKQIFPYDSFPLRGKDKYQAYCHRCRKLRDKKYMRLHSKSGKTRNKYDAFIHDGIEYKKCTSCNKVFPHTFDYFDRCPLGQGGFRSICRKCRLDSQHDFAMNRWSYHLYNNARASSHRSNIEMNINEKYVLELYEQQNGKCYWTGVTLVPSKIHKFPLQPSLDRLDRNKGYIKGNVVLCCFVANFGRNSSDISVWKEFLMTMKEELDYSQWK